MIVHLFNSLVWLHPIWNFDPLHTKQVFYHLEKDAAQPYFVAVIIIILIGMILGGRLVILMIILVIVTIDYVDGIDYHAL